MKDLLYHFDLWDRRKEIGMRRKLAIARVLFHRPNLIFLDEPTSGLDPVASAALREDLRNLTESEGTTVFLTTHNLAEAEQICTQVAVIRKGKLLAKGDPKDLANEGIALKVVIIGSNLGDNIPTLLGMNDEVVSVKVNENQLIVELNKNIEIAPLINLIVNEGAQVEEIHKNRTSLEEAFLKLMAEENDYRHMDNN
jgi:ABC-2 type transport system ATP-binding protein